MTDKIRETNPDYITDNRDLVVILWALGFRLKLLVGVSRVYRTLYFTFESTPELQEVVQKYHSGESIEVDLTCMWAAHLLFQSHMHDTAKDRRIVVSMMALGHKPVAKSRDAVGILRYRFPIDGEEAVQKYLSNERFTVDARSFWAAQRMFSADVNTR
jgi:hypothetical protein